MLTHVNRWNNGKWERITAEEAAIIFPSSVSVRQKLFMCELCGQYVTFTGPGQKVRHFKHSKGETNKECEERSLTYGTTPLTNNDRSLPIKLELKNNRCIFLLGFPTLPDDVIDTMGNERIWIEYGSKKREYRIERFNYGQSTYFQVGNELAKEYRISCSSNRLKEECIFPEVSEGFAEKGRLFDYTSGRMMPFDSDVSIGNSYYYLTTSYLSNSEEPFVKKIMNLEHGYRLYEVRPTSLDHNNADFFLKLRARLTNTPLKVLTIWPPVKQLDETVIHNQKNVLTLLYGNVKLSFNDSLKEPIVRGEDKWSLYSLSLSEKRENVLIGRSHVLKNNQYFFSDKTYEAQDSQVEMFDSNNVRIDDIESKNPPPNNRITVRLEYDGYCYVYGDNSVSYYELSAGQKIELLNLGHGTTIKIYIGNELEKVYTILPRVQHSSMINNEQFIYDKLLHVKGNCIPVSHAVRGALAEKYKDPRIKAWIRKHSSQFPEEALTILKSGIK